MSKHVKHSSAVEHKAEGSKKESKSESKILGFELNTILLLAVLVIATALVSTWVGFGLAQSTMPVEKTVTVNPSLLSSEVESYINVNLLAEQGVSAKITGAKEISTGLYEMPFEIYQDGNVVSEGNVYATDKNLFLVQAAFDLKTPIEQQPVTDDTDPTVSVAPVKSDVPQVDLYIMAFCPYGIRAYDAFKPAFELLNDEINFSIDYIIYPQFAKSMRDRGYSDYTWEKYCTDEAETYCSMHGIGEVNEDVRQRCIQKYQPDKLFNYMSLISADYALNKVSASNIDSLWEFYAKTANVDVAKVNSCVNSEKFDLLDEQLALTEANSVAGSPTAIINGVDYSGARTSDGFKSAICSAFNSAPELCSTALSTAQGAASGSC